MGRKTNSICLRLKKTNKDYIHCWYGDILYGYNFENSVKISKILSNILQTVDIPYPQFSFTGGYKKANLLLCYLESSAKNKDCEIFNIPIRNPFKEKKESTILSCKGVKVKQTFPFFENKKQFSQNCTLVLPETRLLQTQTTIEKLPGFQGFVYKGPLGLNCNRKNTKGYQTQQKVYTSNASNTHIGQHFTYHFWPLFYTSKNFFLYKFRGLTKKPRNLYHYKTASNSASHLQQNTDTVNHTLLDTLFHYLANANNCHKVKTNKNSGYQYREQNLLNFQKSLVFFETCTLEKTKTLVFGKKPSLSYIYAAKPSMFHNCKQTVGVNHLQSNISGMQQTVDGTRDILTGFTFVKQRYLEDKVLEHPFSENIYKQQKGVLQNPHQDYTHGIPLPVKTWDVEKQNYIWCVYNHIKSFWGKGVSVCFIKSSNEKASALFLAHYVSYFLERKVLFRRIKRQLLLGLLSSKKINPWGKNKSQKEGDSFFTENKTSIIGLRISCSGRVGGRSKKAQRSRKETFMWGETGLHVFSNKLDFAKTYAETSFGTVGIQVWICYK